MFNMTRKKPRNMDSLRKMLQNVDLVMSNRDDVYNQTKIHDLENKMDEKFLFDEKTSKDVGFLFVNNKKINLRNSKRC